MAFFTDINVSQGSVSTYARWSGIFNIHLTANLQKIFQCKNFVNRFRFGTIMFMSLWPRFLTHPVNTQYIEMCQSQDTAWKSRTLLPQHRRCSGKYTARNTQRTRKPSLEVVPTTLVTYNKEQLALWVFCALVSDSSMLTLAIADSCRRIAWIHRQNLRYVTLTLFYEHTCIPSNLIYMFKMN